MKVKGLVIAIGVVLLAAIVLLLLSRNNKLSLADEPSHDHISLREVVDKRSEAFLQTMVKEEHFSGTALVTRKAKIVHAKGYGNANGEKKNSVDTVFHIASITKQFTAVATMQLVEAGTVDLGKSINEYLPKKYRSTHWNAVKTSHLLSHTSGIPDYAVVRDYYNVVDGFCLGETVDGMIREAMAKELLFEPGSRFSYSNIGFTLLGCIIENLTSMSYEKYMKLKVLEPMGMSSSRVHVIGHVPAQNEASGHRWDTELGTHVPDDIVSLPVTEPDGGLTTTLSDFIKWSKIYTGGESPIISRESLAKITTAKISTRQKDARGAPQAYGYGLLVSDGLLSHSGYIVGFRSDFIVDTEKSLLIAVFSNNTTNDPIRISTGLLRIADAENEN